MFVAAALSTCSLMDLQELAGFAIYNNKVVIRQSSEGEGLENWTVQIKAHICPYLLHTPPPLTHILQQLHLKAKLKSSILVNS